MTYRIPRIAYVVVLLYPRKYVHLLRPIRRRAAACGAHNTHLASSFRGRARAPVDGGGWVLAYKPPPTTSCYLPTGRKSYTIERIEDLSSGGGDGRAAAEDVGPPSSFIFSCLDSERKNFSCQEIVDRFRTDEITRTDCLTRVVSFFGRTRNVIQGSFWDALGKPCKGPIAVSRRRNGRPESARKTIVVSSS